MSDLRRDAKIVFVSVVATCVAFAIGLAWINFKPSLPSVLGIAPPKFADAKTETVLCKTVQALLSKVKKEVGLPVAIQKDERASVLAIREVPRSDNPLFATSILHRGTGIGEIYFTPQPLPWFDSRSRFGLGVSYGFGSEHQGAVSKLDGYWQPLKIKAVTFRLTGDLTTDGQWTAWGRAGLDW